MPTFSFTADTNRFRSKTEQLVDRAFQAGRLAVADTVRQAERDLEGMMAGAGLGRLAKAWTSTVDGPARTFTPAGRVRPNGKERTVGALRSALYGATITGNRGQLLAVPLDGVGRRIGRGDTRRANSPAEMERMLGRKLRWIPLSGGRFLVVAPDTVRAARGRVRAATRRRVQKYGEGRDIPVFLMLPQVTLRARVSLAAVHARGGAFQETRLRGLLVQAIRQYSGGSR